MSRRAVRFVASVLFAFGLTGANMACSRPPSGAAGNVDVGKPAPEIVTTTHDGKELRLTALRGKPVVVYFYPKDETPGCTKEACGFRDAWTELSKTGVVLVGISTDTNESHRAFAQHHQLPFLLVSDPDGKIADAFAVPHRAGILSRQTVVIGPDGNVKKIYRQVDVATHPREILNDVAS
jgi:peroxiredoxin Q/BCP